MRVPNFLSTSSTQWNLEWELEEMHVCIGINDSKIHNANWNFGDETMNFNEFSEETELKNWFENFKKEILLLGKTWFIASAVNSRWDPNFFTPTRWNEKWEVCMISCFELMTSGFCSRKWTWDPWDEFWEQKCGRLVAEFLSLRRTSLGRLAPAPPGDCHVLHMRF